MVRRIALVLLALAACVGDDPPSGGVVIDGGTTPDSGTSDADSSTGGDTGTPSIDAGTDAQSCLVAADSGIVSWWTGDDTLEDELGVNNMTVGDGGPIAYAPGKVGNAFLFNRTQRLERNAPINLPTAAMTIEAWVKRDGDANERIVDHSTAGQADGFNFDVFLKKLRLQIIQFTATSANDMPIGQVTHVAGTFDGRFIRVFIDGQEVGQTDLGSGVTEAIPVNTLPLRIGGASDSSSRFGGFIDELAIYSRALLPPEIAAIHAAGPNGRCK